MNSMRFQYQLSESEMAQRKKQLDAMLKNETIQRFLQKNQKDSTFLEQNLSAFTGWIERMRSCQACVGKQYCTQPIPGKMCTLDVDETGYLIETYVSCRYERQLDQQLEHAANFKIHHGSRDDLLIHLKTLDISGESVPYMRAYKSCLDSMDASKGLYLYGQPGVGKTFLLHGLANQYAREGAQVAFVSVPRLTQDLKEEMMNSEYRQTVMSALRSSDVLVLDDIGSESISKWTRSEILFPILDYRMNHHKKTYFSSNYTLEELENQYRINGEENTRIASLRMIERIKALSQPVFLNGKSRR